MSLEISKGREFPAEETTGAKALGWGCLIFTNNTSEGALGRVKRAWGEMSPLREVGQEGGGGPFCSLRGVLGFDPQ